MDRAAQFVPAERIARVNPDADNITRLDFRDVKGLEGFIAELGSGKPFRCGRCEYI
jgi:hypothetical protein